MKIVYIDIQNYRKLKSCRISLTEQETLLVGANNSGKTSAMDALIFFLDQKGRSASSIASGDAPASRKLSATDFTLSNWHQLNEFGRAWAAAEVSGDQLGDWQPLCPSVDIWLQVEKNEIHRVSHLIPTLKWDGGLLGVRMIYQPKDLDALKSDFITNYNAAEQLKKTAKDNAEVKRKKQGIKEGGGTQKYALTIWPSSLREYLDREAGRSFELKSYILDPAKVEEVPGLNYKPQELAEDQVSLEFYPFNGLFKVDIIDATRGFTDPNAATASQTNSSNLAGQINKYYNRHLNPTDLPGVEDLEALEAIALAQHSFDGRLNEVFTKPLGEIKTLGYPGFNDPHIRLSSKVNPIDNLDHEAAILFEIQKASLTTGIPLLSLSEKYNGLGYKNLIAMVFKLMSFRDQWMRVGKAGKRKLEDDAFIEPLHLVLIEEPEAHLHAQVQQVFIKKAHSVLRNHADLLLSKNFSSQLVVSTHSSYLAHEVGFEKLRYFKRKPASSAFEVPTAEVIDLSATFGTSKARSEEILQTAQFVARYLKTTHCDLFFANGIILVEGAAERLLIPHFIRSNPNKDTSLDNSYISILEVGGAHAHRLRALIDKLGLPTLVITDTDAMEPPPPGAAPKAKAKAVRPARGKGYKTGSHTIIKWLAVDDPSLDAVLSMKAEEKIIGQVRIAFQYEIPIKYSGKAETLAIPYTFEDAIALTNPELFKGLVKPTGMIKKMQAALNLGTLDLCCAALYEALSEDKAEMALDLLFCTDPTLLAAPVYIQEGLDWLKIELEVASEDLVPGVVEPV